jgi:hypothetical protein
VSRILVAACVRLWDRSTVECTHTHTHTHTERERERERERETLPSRSSSEAPPPVDTKDTCSPHALSRQSPLQQYEDTLHSERTFLLHCPLITNSLSLPRPFVSSPPCTTLRPPTRPRPRLCRVVTGAMAVVSLSRCLVSLCISLALSLLCLSYAISVVSPSRCSRCVWRAQQCTRV